MSANPSLTQHVGGLAAELRALAAEEAAHAGLVAALHALILATLARLLTRLEHMLDLWQAGLLPIPTPRAPRPVADATPHPRARATRRRTAWRTPQARAPEPDRPDSVTSDAPRASVRPGRTSSCPWSAAIVRRMSATAAPPRPRPGFKNPAGAGRRPAPNSLR